MGLSDLDRSVTDSLLAAGIYAVKAINAAGVVYLLVNGVYAVCLALALTCQTVVALVLVNAYAQE